MGGGGFGVRHCGFSGHSACAVLDILLLPLSLQLIVVDCMYGHSFGDCGIAQHEEP